MLVNNKWVKRLIGPEYTATIDRIHTNIPQIYWGMMGFHVNIYIVSLNHLKYIYSSILAGPSCSLNWGVASLNWPWNSVVYSQYGGGGGWRWGAGLHCPCRISYLSVGKWVEEEEEDRPPLHFNLERSPLLASGTSSKTKHHLLNKFPLLMSEDSDL